LHPSYPRLDANYRGVIDEVSLYGRALTDAEIAAIYNARNGGKCTTPRARSSFSQPANQTVTAGDTATFSVVAGARNR